MKEIQFEIRILHLLLEWMQELLFFSKTDCQGYVEYINIKLVDSWFFRLIFQINVVERAIRFFARQNPWSILLFVLFPRAWMWLAYNDMNHMQYNALICIDFNDFNHMNPSKQLISIDAAPIRLKKKNTEWNPASSHLCRHQKRYILKL